MYERTHDHELDEEMGQGTRRMDGRALGLGILIGAAIGAGAALLLAPASGEDTRRQLKRGAKRLYSRSSDAVADLRHDTDRMARRLARRGLKRSRQLMADAREGLVR